MHSYLAFPAMQVFSVFAEIFPIRVWDAAEFHCKFGLT